MSSTYADVGIGRSIPSLELCRGASSLNWKVFVSLCGSESMAPKGRHSSGSESTLLLSEQGAPGRRRGHGWNTEKAWTHGPHIWGFRIRLTELGYTPETTREMLKVVALSAGGWSVVTFPPR